MALKFNYQSTSLTQSQYAAGYKDMAVLTAGGTPVLTTGGTGCFGGKYLDMSIAGGPVPMWPGGSNAPVGSSSITVLWRLIPTFTGLPASNQGLCSIGTSADASRPYGGIDFYITTAAKLVVTAGNANQGLDIFNSVVAGTGFTFTSGVPIDIWFTWNGLSGANGKIYAAQNGNVPTLISTITAAASLASNWSRATMTEITMSNRDHVGTESLYHVNEIAIWDTVEDPTAYGARSNFIWTGSAFEGAAYTDPGVANVRSGTTYTYNGTAQTGTAVIPSAANVRSGTSVDATTGTLVVPTLSNTKIGVAGDGGTGTYDGSDRWSDPLIANVRSGTAYKVNSTSNNRTGTLDLPAVTSVKTGVTFDGASQTGTYDGSDRWSDPGVANTRSGTAYKANSTTNNRTGTAAIPSSANVRLGTSVDAGTGALIVPAATDVKHGVTFDASTVGTYRGADLWSDPGAANVFLSLTYLADGVTQTGLLDEPAPSDVKHGVTYYEGQRTGTYRGADLWSDPGVANVTTGLSYLADGVSKTGTRDTVTNVLSSTALDAPSFSATLEAL